MIFLSAFISFVLLFFAVSNTECSLTLNFDGSAHSALFLDVAHLNHSKEFLLNAQSNTRFFAVLEPNKPVSLKSQFGPISVRETIYPNTIQDALFSSSRIDQLHKLSTGEQHEDILPANSADLSAHLVSSTVYRNSPQLRILFQSIVATATSQPIANDLNRIDHSEHLDKLPADSNVVNNGSEHHMCAVAIVRFNSINQATSESSKAKEEQYKPLVASCALNKEGVCVSHVTIPANWWPSVTLDAVASNNGEKNKQSKHQSSKPGSAEVLYTAVYSAKCGENIPSTSQAKSNTVNRSTEQIDVMANLNWQNNLHVESAGKITLKPFDGTYEELTNDDIIRILIPQRPVHAKTRVHIPVCYRYHRNYPLFAFALRVRVKPGMRVLGAKLTARKTQQNLQPPSNSGKSSKRKQNRLMNEYNRLNTAQNWEISVESNSKQTQTTIKAFLKLNSKDQLVNEEKQIKSEDGEDNEEDDDLDDDMEEFDEDLMNLMPSTCNEVFTILLEVDEKATEYSDAGRIVWQLLYLTDLENSNQDNGRKHHLKRDFEDESFKLTCKLDIQKDEIESVLALTSNRNLLNTAILTGKQNMQPLKIYFVSTAGKFGDVTLQASCASTDETILKVSPSCTALYLDGSETKSSINATILIHYGSSTSMASFQVWMPKLPLELNLSDDELSAVHSWRIPHLKQTSGHATSSSGHFGHRMRKLLSPHTHHSGHHSNSNKHHSHHNRESLGTQTAEIGCRLRYQQAYIEAYAKFYILDENSGREWSFINRKYSFRVTDLILPHLHLSDNRLAILRSNTIEGLNPGDVELKVLSPITGKQLASKKLRVTSDQETITGLQVRLLTGLQMQIKPEQSVLDASSFGHHTTNGPLNNPHVTVWSIRTSENSALTNQYQEGLLDIEIKFSDGKVISLSDVTDADYHLQVDSGSSGMIAYAPGLTASLPRIIALKSGHNIKLDVSLQTSVQCSKKNTLPLQQQTVYLNVNLITKLSNNVHNETAKQSNHEGGKQQISVEHLDSSDNHANSIQNDAHESMLPTAQVQRFHSLYNSQLSVSQRNKLVRPIEQANSNSNSFTGVEIGVYTTLCVFGLLMAAFTTGCFVYAMKQKTNHNLPEFTTVTTAVKNDGDGQDGANGSDYVNTNASRLNKMLSEWTWLQQQANKFNRSTEEDDNQISYDANGNPIIQSKVNICSNPFEKEEDQEENDKSAEKNRQSIISYPGSEISIQITANPIVNAIENTLTNVLKRVEDKTRKDKLQEEACTPEPDLLEIKNMLNYCKTIAPAGTQNTNNKLNHKQPPPIPPRRQQNGSATFIRAGKRTPSQQLPAHIPGIACRTLNAPNLHATNNNQTGLSTNPSSNNSLNSSPINSRSSSKQDSPILSPSLSLSSSDSGIQNELRVEDQSSPVEEKHLITNPFLSNPEEMDAMSQQRRLPPSYFDGDAQDEAINENEEEVYVNTTGPPVPKHNEAHRQRTRIIPPRSLFEEMNYNEIVNYIENMEESSA